VRQYGMQASADGEILARAAVEKRIVVSGGKELTSVAWAWRSRPGAPDPSVAFGAITFVPRRRNRRQRDQYQVTMKSGDRVSGRYEVLADLGRPLGGGLQR